MADNVWDTRNKFYICNDVKCDQFEFTDCNKTDISFCVLKDCIAITVDERSRGWDSASATVHVPIDKWDEFVQHVINLQVKKEIPFVCPIGHEGCTKNCGNYGCGN